MKVTIHVPRIPAGAISNLVGVLGLVAVVVAVGGLTGNWWWSVLTGGIAAVVLAVVAQLGEQSASQAAGVAAASMRPTPVPDERSA